MPAFAPVAEFPVATTAAIETRVADFSVSGRNAVITASVQHVDDDEQQGATVVGEFYIKQNDTGPVIQATLQDGLGAAVDLSGAAVRFHMRAMRKGTSADKVDAVCTVTNAAAGVVQYAWQSGDTDTVGNYKAEFEVTYSGGVIETFPNDENLTVVVKDDIA